MKIQTKIPKLQMNEILQKNVNENVVFLQMFSFTFYANLQVFYDGKGRKILGT